MSDLKAIKNQGVKVNIGGEEKVFKFDLNAFALLEEEYGSLDELNKIFPKKDEDECENKVQIKIKDIRKLLWAGLIHADERLTERAVGSLLSLTDMNEVAKKIGVAFMAAMPEVSEDEKQAKTEGTQGKN